MKKITKTYYRWLEWNYGSDSWSEINPWHTEEQIQELIERYKIPQNVAETYKIPAQSVYRKVPGQTPLLVEQIVNCEPNKVENE